MLEVAGARVSTLAAFLRAVWALGPAGVRVALKVDPARRPSLDRLQAHLPPPPAPL